MNEVIEVKEETAEVTPKPKRCKKILCWASLLFNYVLVIALGLGFFYLWNSNKNLQNKLGQMQSGYTNLQSSHADLSNNLNSLANLPDKMQALASNQDKLSAEWKAAQKGEMIKWHLAEATYLVKVANYQYTIMHDVNSALLLLKRAGDIIQQYNEAGFSDLHQAIATQIASLSALPQINITSLYVEIVALSKQIDQLPLPEMALTPEPSLTSDNSTLPWWKRGLLQTWQGLQQVIVIRKIDPKAPLPLTKPDERLFLYQNLHAQLVATTWGLLNRNNDVYQTSLAKAQEWLSAYFVQQDAKTLAMKEALQKLQAINVTLPANDFAELLNLFAAHANQTDTAQG